MALSTIIHSVSIGPPSCACRSPARDPDVAARSGTDVKNVKEVEGHIIVISVFLNGELLLSRTKTTAKSAPGNCQKNRNEMEPDPPSGTDYYLNGTHW